jgi:hypothetical protein
MSSGYFDTSKPTSFIRLLTVIEYFARICISRRSDESLFSIMSFGTGSSFKMYVILSDYLCYLQY